MESAAVIHAGPSGRSLRQIERNDIRYHSPALPFLRNTAVVLLLIAGLAFLAVPGLRASAQGQAQARSVPGGVVIDHDPMGMTVGSPAPVVGAAPGWRPPVRVVPDASLNQIVIGRSTPITVHTGSETPTTESLRLECYVSLGRDGDSLRLVRLKEGDLADYSLLSPSAAIIGGRATFVLWFHKSVLQAGPGLLSARTVYLVTTKDTGKPTEGQTDNILTVTVLNDDPAAFPPDGGGK